MTINSSRRWRVVALSIIIEALVAVGVIWIIRPHDAAPTFATFRAPSTATGVSWATATVTSGPARHNSAVSMVVVNGSAHAMVITSISSSVAATGMLHVDRNLCDPHEVMTTLSTMEISAHRGVHLGLHGAGAMLMNVQSSLHRGAHVTLVVRWLDGAGTRHVSEVDATVIPAPAHLQYTAPMAM